MNLRNLLISLSMLGCLSAFFCGVQRWRVESRNKRVDLAIDMEEVKRLSDGAGVGVPSLLRQCKSAGATSVAVTEDTLGSLRDQGRIGLIPRDALSAAFPQIKRAWFGDALFVVTSSIEIGGRIRHILPDKYPVEPHLVYYNPQTNLIILGIPGSRELVEDVGLGLDPQSLAMAREAGLTIIGRLHNYASLSAHAIDAMLRDLQVKNVKTAVFARDEVAGYKDLLTVTAETLDKYGVLFGSIEFAKQRGDSELARKLESHILRVHSINMTEAATLQPAEAIERFARAVRERNIRICYIRLLPQLKEDAVGENLTYVKSLATSLEQAGFKLGEAHPFLDFHVAKPLMILNVLGVLATGLWLLDELVTLQAAVSIGVLVGGLLALCGGMVVAAAMVSKLLAFAAACVYPALGYCFSGIDARLRERKPERNVDRESRVMRWALVCFLKSSCITLMGAIMVVGLLSDVRFMVKTDQFIGIKVSQVFPLMIVVLIMVTGVLSTRGEASDARLRLAREEVRRFMGQPILVGVTVMGIVGLAFAALWIARSGNEPGVGVSDLELKVRALLERILIARPRTKEFLIGHPAFLLAAMAAWKGQRSWAIPLALLGIIGQASMLNTFCHIHTPLALSVLRTLNGLWIGIAIGSAIWWLVERRSQCPRESVLSEADQ